MCSGFNDTLEVLVLHLVEILNRLGYWKSAPKLQKRWWVQKLNEESSE